MITEGEGDFLYKSMDFIRGVSSSQKASFCCGYRLCARLKPNAPLLLHVDITDTVTEYAVCVNYNLAFYREHSVKPVKSLLKSSF